PGLSDDFEGGPAIQEISAVYQVPHQLDVTRRLWASRLPSGSTSCEYFASPAKYTVMVYKYQPFISRRKYSGSRSIVTRLTC
ncbi:MAG: hypothetical protein V4671_30915, partial [Armatimonadota bacterium]